MRIGVYTSRIGDACGHIRVTSPLDRLADCIDYRMAVTRRRFLGLRITSHDRALVDSCDLLLLQRDFPRPSTARLVDRLLASGKPLVYDTDDLLTDLPETHPLHRRYESYRTHILRVLRAADAVSVSTPALADALRGYSDRIHVLPNLIDETLWSPAPSRAPDGRVTVGFAGTPSHGPSLALVEEALAELDRRNPGRLAFRFLGCITDRLRQLQDVRFRSFATSYATYAGFLADSAIDIGLAPLEDQPFNRCKSNIKWLEYSACGIAGVYSDVTPYRADVVPERTGMLAANTTSSWVDALERLIQDAPLRRRIAAEARERVMARYSLRAGAPAYREFLESVLRGFEPGNPNSRP